MDYDIAFLSFVIPREMNDEIRSKSSNRMEDAAIAWQEHIIAGIEEATASTVKMINILPVEAFPAGYKDAWIRRRSFQHTASADDVNVGFCNIKLIKRMLQWAPVFREVDAWAGQGDTRKKVLIAYTMYPEFMRAISHVKKKWPEIITIAIVVDLPQFIALGEKPLSALRREYQKWSKAQAEKNMQYVDGFAVITGQMGELLCADKPHVIIEGICSREFPPLKQKEDPCTRVIYAGLLHKKFGIIKLLDAFAMIKDPDFRLVICGIGEAEDEIVRRAAKDNRIEFLGTLTRESVLAIMSGCDIIVNPRENKGEYTKYSFPSKNLEALSSGIPFIGYKLDGIPDEYDVFINYPENGTAEALSECIYNVGKKQNAEAKQQALQAKDWVQHHKSTKKQGDKIIGLIQEIHAS